MRFRLTIFVESLVLVETITSAILSVRDYSLVTAIIKTMHPFICKRLYLLFHHYHYNQNVTVILNLINQVFLISMYFG